MRLSADGLCKRYGDRDVLVDCSLAVTAGECILLRGPSGGGKSTLLRILALLETADSGTVFHGQQSFAAGGKTRQPPYPFLTVVFQQLFLWPNLTMSQNLAIVLHQDPHASVGPDEMAMLERFSIAHLLQRLPHECSLGERQRLAVARALLSEAKFLLLDEPSSALDKANRKVLIMELTTATAQNRGVLIVTHDDRAFDQLAAQIFELENGRLTRFER
jgi:ABC-type sugar transport system ATPase subunit